jgi:hypothetical protein
MSTRKNGGEVLHKLFASLQGFWRGLFPAVPDLEQMRQQRDSYEAVCPSGHVFTLSRVELFKLPLVSGQLNGIELGFVEYQPIAISYTDCQHPECQTLAAQHRYILEDMNYNIL